MSAGEIEALADWHTREGLAFAAKTNGGHLWPQQAFYHLSVARELRAILKEPPQ